MRALSSLIILATALIFQGGVAEVLDPNTAVNDQLKILSADLDRIGVDVAFNLNESSVARRSPQRPRIGMHIDIPSLRMASSAELLMWEQEYQAQRFGTIAFIVENELAAKRQAFSGFYQDWLASAAEHRILLSYALNDEALVREAVALLADRYAVLHVPADGLQVEQGGRLFATAGQRWVLDSAAARDVESELPEFQYLGESMRRGTESVINPKARALRRLARAEPAVFLKERLGDEFEASTIPEIIVPGGIALGEKAVFTDIGNELRFDGERLWLNGPQGALALPEATAPLWKASFDFAARAVAIASDAIVDIDERGRVKISSALEDTDLGFRMVRIDLEPFNFVTRLDVQKSVIIDSDVEFRAVANRAQFQVEYEVRFLQSDRMRIARTEAAIVYRYRSEDGSLLHLDSWGPSAFRLEERTDFLGLGASTRELADYAAWVALFRAVHEQQVEFTYGRYEFLKIDKSGRSTPSRI